MIERIGNIHFRGRLIKGFIKLGAKPWADCSARKYSIYQRGTVGSYQWWEDVVGDQSYGWKNFLPYFQKSVTFTPSNTSLRFANSTPQYDAEAAAGGNKESQEPCLQGSLAHSSQADPL